MEPPVRLVPEQSLPDELSWDILGPARSPIIELAMSGDPSLALRAYSRNYSGHLEVAEAIRESARAAAHEPENEEEALARRFEDLLYRARRHDEAWCTRHQVKYNGPPGVDLAEEFKALALDCKEEDDAEVARGYETSVRRQAEAAEAARKREEVRERAAAEQAKKEAQERAEARALAEKREQEQRDAERAAEQAAASASRDGASRKGEEARFAVEEVTSPFGELPPLVWRGVLRCLSPRSLCRISCASAELRRLALSDDNGDGTCWHQAMIRGGRHPRLGQPAGTSEDKWRSRFVTSLSYDANWNRRHSERWDLRHHSQYLTCTAMSRGIVAFGSMDGSLSLVSMSPRAPGDVQTQNPGRLSATLSDRTTESGVQCAAFLQNEASNYGYEDAIDDDQSRVLVSGTHGGFVQVWRIDPTRWCSSQPWHERAASQVTLLDTPHAHADCVAICGERMAFGGATHRQQSEETSIIGVYDGLSNGMVASVCHLTDPSFRCEVYGVSWMGQHCVSAACGDGAVRMWDVRVPRNKASFTLKPNVRCAMRCVVGVEESSCLIAGDSIGSIRRMDIRKSSGVEATFTRKFGSSVNAIQASPRLRRVVAGCDDGALHVLRWPTLDKTSQISFPTGVTGVDMDHTRLSVSTEDTVGRAFDFTGKLGGGVDFTAIADALRLARQSRTAFQNRRGATPR